MGTRITLGSRHSTLAEGLVAVVAVLAFSGSARAAGMFPEGFDDCLLRTTLAAPFTANDDVNSSVSGPQTGNFWARRDRFALDQGSECYDSFISGLSVVVKTPFQLTPDPDVDDMDSLADFELLGDELSANFPDFDHFSANAIIEAGGGSPADFASFHGVSFCIYVGTTGTIAGCLSDGPTVLSDLDGSSMRFGLDFGSGAFSLSMGECSPCLTEFELVTVLYSDAFGEQIGSDLPEAVLGWQFVPEPALAALLAPGLVAWALGRRRLRHR